MVHDHDRSDERSDPASLNYDHPVREQERADQAATERRLEREEAFVGSGRVAGHDFKREHEERERGWERGR